MHVAAHLNIDLLAHNTDEDVTCLVNLQAPEAAAEVARPGQTLVIVLDRSGSMSGAPIAGAKKAIAKLARRLAPQDAFGLVVFDDRADVIVPVRTMADHHMPSLLAAVDSVTDRGSTDISAGYLLGLREAKRSLASTGQRGATVLIVSDGGANAGITDPIQLDALALNAFRTDSITTSTLGLSEHYNELQLAALTHGGNGEHRFAPDVDTAVAELGQLVGNLLDKSVVGAHLRITRQPALVSAVMLRNQLPAFLDGETVVVSLGDMYAHEERTVLVKFHVPGLQQLGTTTIADIVVEYTSMPDLRDHTVTLPIAVNVVPGDEARGRVPNPAVEVAELLADLADDKQSAGEALRNGDQQRARHTIDGSMRKLRDRQQQLADRSDVEESVKQLLVDAGQELAVMVDDLQSRDAQYNSKMMMQSFSAEARGRRTRPRAAQNPEDEQ